MKKILVLTIGMLLVEWFLYLVCSISSKSFDIMKWCDGACAAFGMIGCIVMILYVIIGIGVLDEEDII